MKNKFYRISAFLFFVCSSIIASHAFAHAPNTPNALDNAFHWLQLQQIDGVFEESNHKSLVWQSNYEALEAFSVANKAEHLSAQSLLHYFNGQENLTTEFLSRRILLKLRLGKSVQDDLQTLKTRQNRDGGFGNEQGFDSSVYDTAFALYALASAENTATPTSSGALSYLKTQQQSNGSFSLDTSNNSSTYITALAVRAITPYLYTFDISDLLTNAKRYLYSQADANGGLEDDWEAAQFLLAVIPTTTDAALYEEIIDWLKLQQLESGSWQGDTYTTALVIQALHLGENISHPISLEVSTLTGRLLDSSNKQPLYNAQVSIGDNQLILTDKQGKFSISNLEEGAYQITYSLDGFYSANQSISIQRPQLINLGDIYLDQKPEHGVVSGVIVSNEDNRPIEGARVTVEQSSSSQEVVSDLGGHYSLLVSEGNVSVTVQHEDYHSVQANAFIESGEQLQFSVGLTPLEDDVVPLTLKGILVDADTLRPLEGVEVSIAGTTESAITNNDGVFEALFLSGGQKILSFSKPGYQSIQQKIMLPEQGKHDLGMLLLDPIQASATRVHGFIVDANTGEGIANATVSIEGQAVTSSTDGYYVLEEISSEDFVVGAQAEGYSYSSQAVRLNKATNLSINITMLPINETGIELLLVETDSMEYEAYQPVRLSAVISNKTVRERRVMFYVHILDAEGQIIDRFSAAEIPMPPSDDNAEAWAHYQQHIKDATEWLAPNDIRNVNFEVSWNSGQQKPGNYTALVQALDSSSSVVLAEQKADFSILPTQRFTEIAAAVSPAFALVNSQAELQLSALLRNSSNLPIQGTLDWSLYSPEGAIVATGQKEFSAEENIKNIELLLDEPTVDISTSGQYILKLTAHTSAEVGHLIPANLFVPPHARLIIEQDLAPQIVLPGSERRSQVRIEIKGVEGK